MGHRVPLRALTLAAAPFLAGSVAFVVLGSFPSTSADGRAPLGLIIFGLCAATSAAGLLLSRLTAYSGSLRRTVLIVALAAMAVTGASITVSSATMLLPAPELLVLVILFLFGAALGVILEWTVAHSLSDDLRRLRRAAAGIAQGDYRSRVGIDRSDEIGEAAAVIDGMGARLAAMEDERAQAQESRRAFLSAVGHDLRTPLAALRAAVEALEDGLVPGPHRYYSAMRHDLDAMTALVDDLFLLARIESGHLRFTPVAVDLAELADEAVEALAPVARQRGIGVRLVTPGKVHTMGGPALLSRALRNLLDNAIRHTPPASEVVVEVHEADGALVRVVDQGPGFPDDLRERLFDGYTRVDGAEGRTAGGTGLGLTIAQRLIEAHRGRIWIEPGPGGRVSFRVPSMSRSD